MATEEHKESENLGKKRQKLRLIRRSLRDNSRIFDFDDDTFTRIFRLNKAAFKYVLQEISPLLKRPQRSTGIALETKLAGSLKLLGEGSYQLGAGSDFNVGLAQPTMSTNFEEVLNAMEKTLCDKWIVLERSAKEMAAAKKAFYGRYSFPGIVGCIGCTPIKLITPSKETRNMYYNEKGFPCLNALIACDHKMRIMYFDAQPGSYSDLKVWESSNLKAHMQNKYAAGDKFSWLLGSDSFPLEGYLMTPFAEAVEGSPEAHYNEAHYKARNVAQRTISLLKNRFKCLTSARQLHYKPDKVKRLTTVCVALHNICIHYKSTYVQLLRRQEFDIDNKPAISDDQNDAEAVLVRNEIATALANT